MLSSENFMRHIKDWVVYSQKYLYTMKDRPDLTCYGVGSNAGGNSWGMQTNQKAAATFIVASHTPSIDWSGTGLTAETVRQQGLAMLRFTLASHKTGDYHCTDGSHWGQNWISTLGTARMMHAINIVWDELTDKDKQDFRRVLLSEADWLLNEHELTAGLIDNNHPESNIWNGALLYQAACLYPDAENTAAYKEHAIRSIINGISTESDEFSTTVYDGIMVKDAFVGANMFDTMACDHHGYMNVGYMVICLSNLAMLYFWCKDRGFELPQVFDHHVMDAWKLIRSCTFEDGRLWRIGGDTRVRYCYCQDYAVPMWAMMAEKYDQDCEDIMAGWLDQVATEVKNNGDGSFLSDRLSYMLDTTPYYYTRLESDRACTLSMVGYWMSKYPVKGNNKPETLTEWYDKYHGSLMQKGKNRYASFTWIAGERPTAMNVPANESSLAEWQQNMTGKVRSFGAINQDRILEHTELMFDGGFLTYGKSASESNRFYCEGYRMDTPAIKTLAYAALPDDSTAICIQRAISPNRIFARCYSSLMLRIPNDVYNHNTRKFYSSKEELELKGGKHAQKADIQLGNWLNVDDKMGVVSDEELTLRCPAQRQIEIDIRDIQDSNRDGYGTLYCNDIVGAYNDIPSWFNPGDEIYRCSFAVNVGSAQQTAAMANSFKKYSLNSDDLIAAGVEDVNGTEYLLVLNTGTDTISAQLPQSFELFCGSTSLGAGQALLAVRK